MKKHIPLIAAALLLLPGCLKEPDAGTITVEATVGPATKVAYDGAKSSFAAGDRIAVYAWTGSAAEVPATRVVDGVVNSYDGSAWTPASLMRWRNGFDAHYFLGVSPVHAISSFTADAYPVDPADYAASDLLFAANLGGVKSGDGAVKLAFRHAMAKLNVNLTFRSQWTSTPEVGAVTVSAKQTASVNYLSQSVGATGDAAAVSLPALTANSSYSAILAPQDGVRKITVTIAGKDYVYTAGEDIPLASGQVTTVNLAVGRDQYVLELASGITIGDWVDDAALPDVEVPFFTNAVKIPAGLVLSFPDVDGRGVEGIRLIPRYRKETGDMVSLTSIASPAELFTGSGGKVFDAVGLPRGTSAALVYAQASDKGTDPFENGALSISGLSGTPSLDEITFAPVPVYTEDSDVEGKLLAILNAVADAKPEDYNVDGDLIPASLSDNTRPAFKEVTEEQATTIHALWNQFSMLKTCSSSVVERALFELYATLDGNSTLAAKATVPNAYKMAIGIRSVIDQYCSVTITSGVTISLTLKDEYQGFPADVMLPAGAVGIAFDPADGVLKAASRVVAREDFVYPASRQYFADSPLRVSNTAVPTGMGDWTWNAVLDAFTDGASVTNSTVSAAQETPVRPGVARLDVQVAGLDQNEDYLDNEDEAINVWDGYSLTAILIGGQRAVGWDFAPKGTKKYSMYGRIPDGEVSTIKRDVPSAVHAFYLLPSGQSAVNVALEFVNNGASFTDAGNNPIYHGCAFYLLGTLKTADGQPLFKRGGKVTATFTIRPVSGFSKAVQILPDLNATTEYEGAFTITLNTEDE
ncbi:MAG: fimbrillin family protein [Bacteroidales bacterium]|nr:fimbrillin family protein [Bacteroidales bacterium]